METEFYSRDYEIEIKFFKQGNVNICIIKLSVLCFTHM